MLREKNHTKSPHVLRNAGSEPVAMPVAVEMQSLTAMPSVKAVPVESPNAFKSDLNDKAVHFPSLVSATQHAATRYEAFLRSWCSMSFFSVRNEGRKRLNEIKNLLGMSEKSISDLASQATDSQVVNALAKIINSSSSVFKGYLADSIFQGSVSTLNGYEKGCVSSSVVDSGWLNKNVPECTKYHPAHVIGSFNLNKNALMYRLLVAAENQTSGHAQSQKNSQ